MNPTLSRFWAIRRERLRHLVVSGALTATTTVACGGSGEGSGAIVAERDSAGIRIVTLTDVYRAPLPEWRIEERLTIGQPTGPREYELYDVEDATVLGDGRIAVANRGSSEVRIYDRDGQHVKTFGREGEGPGEFRRLSWLGRADGDTLVTYDTDLRRATWFTDSGEVVRTLKVESGEANPANATPFGTTLIEPMGIDRGRLLVRTGYLRRSGEGEYRDTFTIAHVDERGALVDDLGPYAGRELFFHSAQSGGGNLRFVTLALPPIFGRDTHVGAFAGRLVAGSTDHFELDVYNESRLLMKILAGVELAPVTQWEVEAWLQDRREHASELSGPAAEVARGVAENAPVRDTPPAFHRLVVDSQRSIWVEEPYRVPDGPSRWIVLADDGTPTARVELPLKGPTTPRTPPDLTILEIGKEYILGLRRDEYDIEQIIVYRLERTY